MMWNRAWLVMGALAMVAGWSAMEVRADHGGRPGRGPVDRGRGAAAYRPGYPAGPGYGAPAGRGWDYGICAPQRRHGRPAPYGYPAAGHYPGPARYPGPVARYPGPAGRYPGPAARYRVPVYPAPLAYPAPAPNVGFRYQSGLGGSMFFRF